LGEKKKECYWQHFLPPLRTIHPNPAQEKNKRCAAKHPPLRTFLCKALYRRFDSVWCSVPVQPTPKYN
jgi:hypothetical protein